MSSRVQSPNVGDVWRMLGAAAPPTSFPVLPAMMGIVNFPYCEYRYSEGSKAGWGDDTSLLFITVPEEEEWFVHHMSITHTAGDGHINYIYALIDPEYWTPTATATKEVYISGEITTFPYILNFPSGLPLTAGSKIYVQNDFNSVADTYYLRLAIIRRKW